MKNIIKKIGGLCLGLAMLCGVSYSISKIKPIAVSASDYTATLSQSSSTANYVDSEGNTWTLSTESSDSVSVDSNAWLKTGTNSKAAKSISLECDAYSEYVIDTVTIHVKAKASTGSKGHIYIGGEEVAVSSSELANSDTTLSYNNSQSKKSGSILVSVERSSSQIGALYLGTIIVEYSSSGPTKELVSIAISGAPTKTNYEDGDEFDPTGLVVTGTYSDKSTGTIDSGIDWDFNPTTLAEGNTSCEVTATVDSISSAPYTVNGLTVSAPSLTTIYDFETNFSTYAASWSNGYAAHTGLKGKEDIGGKFSANIDLDKASKQTSNITSMPVFATRTSSGNWYNVLKFTLQETGKEIDSVTVTFTQWPKKTPDAALFKGLTTTGNYIDSATIGTKNTLCATNLGGSEFSIGYCDKEGSNVQAGLKSIEITIRDAAVFGTLDHISIISNPNKTIYHVGQTFNTTGLLVKAFDGADEMSAQSKDIEATLSVENGHVFNDLDLSVNSVTASYTEDTITKTASFPISVFGVQSYKKVSSISDGKYIIVDNDGSSGLVALDANCDPLDQTGDKNDLAVSATDNIITTGEELEVTITNVEDDLYSIQLKNGKYLSSPGGSSSGISYSDDPVSLSLSYVSNHIELKGLNSKYFGFDSSADNRRFRFNKSNPAEGLQLYKVVNAIDEFCEYFLDTLSTGSGAVCKYNPTTQEVFTDLEELQLAWACIALEFDELGSSEKNVFKSGSGGSTTNLEKTLALYDFICEKYGKSLESEDLDNYNFMDRVISNSSNYLSNILPVSNSTTWIIIAVSLAGLTAIGGYFFYKKRKENF